MERLRIEIRGMSRRTALYHVLKEELSKVDHWKMQERGDAMKGYLTREAKKKERDSHA